MEYTSDRKSAAVSPARRVAVLGLGYVGTVTAACLAAEGHTVIGVDISDQKVDLINQGLSPIREPGTDEMIAEAVAAGRLRATTQPEDVIAECDLSIVCVGTPSARDGQPDYTQIDRVCHTLGTLLPQDHRHIIAVRSTILPGTAKDLIAPTIEKASGMTAGDGFGFAHIPEFLREGTAIRDYLNPPKTIIGTDDTDTATFLLSLFEKLPGVKITVPVNVAEAVKFTDNVWHALKVGFGNEIGSICKALEIDSHAVMDIFCQDTKLNISPNYLTPGFAFGGSCLPKDTRGLSFLARRENVGIPIINSVLPSNADHIQRGLNAIIDAGRQKIGILGCSFKPHTDDLRESPIVEIIERLIGKGYDVHVFDPNVQPDKLVGANRSFAIDRLPHISRILLNSLSELVERSETVVVGTNDPRFGDLPQLVGPHHHVVDFVRLANAERIENYHGLCW